MKHQSLFILFIFYKIYLIHVEGVLNTMPIYEQLLLLKDQLSSDPLGLAIAAGVMGGAIGETIRRAGSILIVHWLYKGIKKQREENEEKRDLLINLFGFIRESQVIIDKRYPWKCESIDYNDRQALEGLNKLFNKSFRCNRKIEYINGNIGNVDINNNLCLIGSPIPNRLVRCAMGYDISTGAIISHDLPYLFNLSFDPRCENKNFKEIQRIEDKSGKEPNWAIMDSNTYKDLYIPELDKKGILHTDYSMITVMKNNLTKQVYGKKLMIAFGCHGAGTAALKSIFDNLKILKDIDNKRGSAEDFQVILKSDIENKKGLRIPKNIKVIRVESI